jgi:coproporphyrinogen III oxidase
MNRIVQNIRYTTTKITKKNFFQRNGSIGLGIGTMITVGIVLCSTTFADSKDIIPNEKGLEMETEHELSFYDSKYKSFENKILTAKEKKRREDCEKVYDNSAPMNIKMETLVLDIQARMVSALSAIDGSEFLHDSWERKEGGYGTSCVLQSSSSVFEKAGVNVSIIRSPAPQTMIKQMRARKSLDLEEDKDYDMFVAGCSMVIHPWNPKAPTFHANYRYFELHESGSTNSKPVAAWFGGGCDLTPSYLFKNDAVWFHKTIKEVCDRYDKTYYSRFKDWCDQYFHNTHRGERRGIGGIFFDDLEPLTSERTPSELFQFVKECGLVISKQYIPIVLARKDMQFTEKEKEWQQIRRGRYVEFNLVFHFHLDS